MLKLSKTLGLLSMLWLAACALPSESKVYPEKFRSILDNIRQAEREGSFDGFLFSRSICHPNPHVRRTTARALGRIDHEECIDLLVSATGESELDNNVLSEVAFALGQIADAEAFTTLSRLSEHENIRVRAAAIEAIGKLKGDDPKHNELLIGALKDSSMLARGAACLALFRKSCHGAVGELLAVLANERERPEVRWQACYAIYRMKHEQTKGVLRPYLTSPDPWIRNFAAASCANPIDSGSVNGLVDLLQDSKSFWTAKVHAADSIASILKEGYPETSTICVRLLRIYDKESNGAVRRSLLSAMAQHHEVDFAHEEIKKLLLNTARSEKNLALRAHALEQYATLLEDSALGQIRTWAKDSSPAILRSCAKAFGKCGNGAQADLMSLMQSSDDIVREYACNELLSSPDSSLWDQLVQLAKKDSALGVRGTVVTQLIKHKPKSWKSLLRDLSLASPEDMFWEVRVESLKGLMDEEEFVLEIAKLGIVDRFKPVRVVADKILKKYHSLDRQKKRRAPKLELPFDMIRPEQLYGRHNPRLHMQTDKGEIVFELFLQDAPVHVSNFIYLARSGFYDGLLFHRVVPAFVVQGGDPLGTGWGDAGYLLPDEINGRAFGRGILGMPKSAEDNTGGCQIFVTHEPTPHLDGRYTVFGRVMLGMENIDALEVGDRIIKAWVPAVQFRDPSQLQQYQSGD